MANLEQILKDLHYGVLSKMEDTILAGGTSFHYETEYGCAFVDIDFHEVCNFPWLSADWDVTVSHEDGHKRSPLLEKAIEAVMPDWFETKEKVREAIMQIA